ncbi:MAG: 23S rRNA (adenine(2030)-N(6))-methyltransferase RlmJ [Rhizobiales bacterium]|nr:23S rRNA (adenine(2030)-N(6))-methyltransferase RlmJ [Hyphomicrobiales bacterium]
MNYRHAFHAGNFADVVKHAVFTRILLHLRQKPAPFRVIDTHAGSGVYDLASLEARRSGEWREGIHRLLTASLAPEIRDLLASYLDSVEAFNEAGQLACYPGSPALARHWLRAQDRLIACELEPTAAAALARNLRGDTRVKTLNIDGWTALSAYLPPKERRGVVLIDPPFEQPAESVRLAEGLAIAHRKWATGIYLAWYPIKDARENAAFARRIARLGIAKILRVELTIAAEPATNRLRGTGLLAINPPWTLAGELAGLLPALATILSPDGRGESRLDWLAGE